MKPKPDLRPSLLDVVAKNGHFAEWTGAPGLDYRVFAYSFEHPEYFDLRDYLVSAVCGPYLLMIPRV